MKDKKVIEHIAFKNLLAVSDYYSGHQLAKALGEGFSIIRIMYPEGYYDGYYVFAAMNDNTEIEVDMPRTLIDMNGCSQADYDFIEEMYVEEQPNGPEIVRYETYVIYKTYKKVKEHFKDSLESVPEMEVIRVNYIGDLPHADYKNCYIFIAYNTDTDMEMDLPRALLPKNQCTKKDNKEIDKIRYLDHSDDETDLEDPSEVPPNKPDSGSRIN